jgi:hypothetical protein
MYFFTAAKEVLFNPKAFFESKREDNQLAGTFFYGFMLVVVSALIRYIYLSLTNSFVALEKNKDVVSLASVFNLSVHDLVSLSIIILSVLVFIGLLITPLFLHLGMKIVKGTGSLSKTYQVYIFAATPALLLNSIPFISFVATIYGIYIAIIGLSIFHNLRFDYSALGYVLGRVIGFVCSVILVIVVAFILVLATAAMWNSNPQFEQFKERLQNVFPSATTTQATTTEPNMIQSTSSVKTI